MYIQISIANQTLDLIEEQRVIKQHPISTAYNGSGERLGSECTPLGWHTVRAKIGHDLPQNVVFSGREPTGELCTREYFDTQPERDWIITRILWLSGLEPGKNSLNQMDTYNRYVYIHGTPDWTPLGTPGSRGCIRMHNAGILELFAATKPGTKLYIC